VQKMKAFSLLELSIVVAIASLIITATTIGQHILERAKIISTINQFNQLETAITNFKDRYYFYPGDFNDAFRYFDNGENICGTEKECNGDGDNKIEIGEKYSSESYRAWQHLSLAKIIKGSFSGIWGQENYLMQAKISGNLTIKHEDNIGNIIKLGEFYSVNGQTSDVGAILPENAEIIDKKIDDSLPRTGQIIGMDGIAQGSKQKLYDKNCLLNNKYKVNHKASKACTLGFKIY